MFAIINNWILGNNVFCLQKARCIPLLLIIITFLDVSLVASNAIINSTVLTLDLTLTGYTGDMDQTVTVRPRLEYLSNQSLGGIAYMYM